MDQNINDRDEVSRTNPGGLDAQFLRLPKPPKRCALTGLTRASLNTLILGDNPKVRSVVVKQPGTKRGVRLIHRQSLVDWIYAEMVRQEEDRKSPANGSGEGNKRDR